MSLIHQLHQQSMSLLDEAQAARVSGDVNASVRLRQQAFEAERDAANLLRDRLDMEPTRSILYKGAAILALQRGLNADVQELARKGMAGRPPDYVLEQLQSVLAKGAVNL